MTARDAFGGTRFEGWTSDNGLPQNSVYSILQTRDGYLWFTTLGGLVRYDGVRFNIFNKANSAGIAGNRFTTLYEGADGSLWIGTEGSGLTRYTGGTFVTYTEADGLPDMQIKAVRGDADGRLWVFTRSGVAEWTDGGRFARPTRNQPTAEQLDAIQRARRQTGFSFFDRAGFHVFVGGEIKTYTTRDGLSSLDINSVYQDQFGTFWIETRDHKLNRLKDSKIIVYNIRNASPADAPDDETRITAVHEDRKGNLWIARRGRGLSRWREGGAVETFAAKSLPSTDIETIYEDREGNIWLGTFNNGLSRVAEHVFEVYSEAEGLPHTNVYPMLEDRAGNIWIGTWGGELYKLRDGAFMRYGKAQGLSYQAVGSLYEDSRGSLWVGTFGGGVNRFVDGKFVALTTQDGLPGDNIRAITEDVSGAMWFGTTNGLARYKDGRFKVYGTSEGLPDKEVQTLVVDRAGALWIGTLGGVARYAGDQFTRYTEREGLSSNYVRVIHEDREGIIWIGTYDGGLSRLKDGKISRITMRDGLYDDGAFQILEDDAGNFWMSCNRGVYRVRRDELNEFADGKRRSVTSVHYGKADGLLNTECNGGTQPAGFRARDGRLWFPTQDGVAVVNPRSISGSVLPPPVAVEELVIDNQPVVFRDRARVPSGVESFDIRYTGLSFIKPEQVRFRYKLEGLDSDWVEAGTRRTAYYSHVPPGNYVFKVMAANSDGVWNTREATLTIEIVPPFWRTWWFLALSLVACAAIAALAYRRRIAGLERRQLAQQAFSRQLIESQERERKRIAAELHDSLGQNLLVIKNRALMGLLTDDAGQTLKQLDEISSTASQSIEEVREIAYNLHPYQLDRLGLSKALKAMLEKVSNSSGIRFFTSIDEIDDLLPQEYEINLFRVVQESVNNIVKHSEATEATVSVRRANSSVRLDISDNGKGFSRATVATSAETPGGLGLRGINERVQMLGGKCSIESTPGGGTSIAVLIKLSEAKQGTNGN